MRCHRLKHDEGLLPSTLSISTLSFAFDLGRACTAELICYCEVALALFALKGLNLLARDDLFPNVKMRKYALSGRIEQDFDVSILTICPRYFVY